MRSRTLRLRKETLAELTTMDLEQVVGGQFSIPTCLDMTRNCPTFDSCWTGTTVSFPCA